MTKIKNPQVRMNGQAKVRHNDGDFGRLLPNVVCDAFDGASAFLKSLKAGTGIESRPFLPAALIQAIFRRDSTWRSRKREQFKFCCNALRNVRAFFFPNVNGQASMSSFRTSTTT
jgi:hypothetical protein